MKKIAIVGVEGSGKTVLMAAMGDKYKSPDANGIYLKPVNRETFEYCERLMGQMQDGKWPIATGRDITDNLRWTLTRKVADGDDDRIAELSFLDFGGEIYRLAFGGGVHDEPDEDTKNAITQLRSHVEEAEVLIVLVNLSDIINGKRNEERTIEMNWLSQAILSFAYDKAKKSSVALVFTQADSYAEIITDCGDLRGVLTRYMPTVDTSYGKRLSLFSVAAVNRTVFVSDGSGFQVPSPDFKPQGLEKLVSWVVDSVEGKNKRKRWKIAVGLIGLLGILGFGSWIGYNVNAEFKNWVDDQLMGIGWMQKETLEPLEPRPVVPSVKPVEEPTKPPVATKPPVEPAKQPKPEPKWVAGVNNPNNPHLVAGESRNTWVATRPGYVWVEGTDRDEWKQGLRHPENSKLVSDWKEGEWKSTEEGYVWVGGSRTEWRAGIESTKHPHWVSIVTDEHPTGYWRPMPGYSKKNKDEKGLSELVWTQGQRNPDVPHIYSDEKEGWWCADAGYKWRKMGDVFAGVYWEPGEIVNGRKTGSREGQWLKQCSACNGRGKKNCWKCDGDGRINCTSCRGSGRVETTESERCGECNGTGEREQPCPQMNRELNLPYGHVNIPNGIVWEGKHVFLCRNCGGMEDYSLFVSCPACRGLGFEPCPTCNGNTKVRVDCDNCDNGYRTRQTTKKCSDCSGRGTVICPRSECHSGKVSCSSCNGDGWIPE